MYVLGEKLGQRVLPNQRQPVPSTSGVPGMPAMGGGMQHQAAMLAQQSREMEQLERRQARERAAGMGAHAVRSLYYISNDVSHKPRYTSNNLR